MLRVARSFFIFLLLAQGGFSQIIETVTFRSITEHLDQESVVLVDLDDTLIDLPITAGTKSMRHFIKRYAPDLHDPITLHLTKILPAIPVDPEAKEIIASLQKEEISIFGFTARGADFWYDTPTPQVDLLSHQQLLSLGIDFSKSPLPFTPFDHPCFRYGTFFTDADDKGAYFKEICEQLNWKPKKLILIDDKLENLLSLESAFEGTSTEVIGYWFRLTEKKSKSFNPLIGLFQLCHYLHNKVYPSDEEATSLLMQEFMGPCN